VLEAFLAALPRSTAAAAGLAVAHDARLEGRAHLEVEADLPIRHALEVRSPTFQTPEFVELLRRQDVALVVADTAGKWPFMEDVTSDFVYARLHGDKELYVSGYGADALDTWAAKFKAWRGGGEPADARRVLDQPARKRKSRDVFVYFDNDVKVRAPFDAAGLAARLGVATDGGKEMLAATMPDFAAAVASVSARERWPAIGKPGALPTKRARVKRATS
jgi:uncharacterized protein YecE (DUF72 family)